jgi:hypothetical protein
MNRRSFLSALFAPFFPKRKPMPLPAQISLGGNHFSPIPESGKCGPHEHNSALYLLLAHALSGVQTQIEAWKSTDGGETWAEVDAANHPPAGSPSVTGSEVRQCVFRRCSDKRYLKVCYGDIDNKLRICVFDMQTDTWGTPSSVGPETGFPRGTAFFGGGASLVQRSDDDYVVLYTRPVADREAIGAETYSRIAYVTYDGSSWGSPVEVGETGVERSYAAMRAVVGADDRIHFFVQASATAYSGFGSVRHRSLSSSYSLGTLQNISDVWRGDQRRCVGAAYADSSRIIVPFISDDGTDTPTVKIATASAADNPVWSLTTVNTAHPYIKQFTGLVACTYHGGTTVVVWDSEDLVTFQADVYYAMSSDSWTEHVLQAGDIPPSWVSPHQPCINLISGKVGVVWSSPDAGAARPVYGRYNTIDLGGARECGIGPASRYYAM